MSHGIQENRARARLGDTLNGKYRLERLLGVGGMAAVFEAVHRNQGRFALKLLHPEISVDPDARRRFLKEGYAANVVDHRGVVRALDDDVSEDGSAFLVLELLNGQSLDAWALGRPSERKVMEVLYQALDILSAAHDRGVTHRDLKPENLFLTDDGLVKILDFGLARVRAAAEVRMTKTGEVFGTPAFMPPEQARGDTKDVDARSDQWAMAATIFNVLSRKLVHEAKSTAECILAAATKPARSVAEVAPELPRPFVEVIDRALAFERKDRWPSARAMRAALAAAYLSVYGERAPSVTRSSATRAAKPRPRWPLALAGAAALLAAAGAAWALRGKESPSPVASAPVSAPSAPPSVPTVETSAAASAAPEPPASAEPSTTGSSPTRRTPPSQPRKPPRPRKPGSPFDRQ